MFNLIYYILWHAYPFFLQDTIQRLIFYLFKDSLKNLDEQGIIHIGAHRGEEVEEYKKMFGQEINQQWG